MTNGVLTLDDEGRVVTTNKACMRILKVGEEEILGAKAEEFFAGENQWILDKIAQVNETLERTC